MFFVAMKYATLHTRPSALSIHHRLHTPIRHSSDDAPMYLRYGLQKQIHATKAKRNKIDRDRIICMAKLVTISVLDFVCEDCLAYTIIRL